MTVAGARERGQRRPSNPVEPHFAESAEAADEIAAQFEVGLGEASDPFEGARAS